MGKKVLGIDATIKHLYAVIKPEVIPLKYSLYYEMLADGWTVGDEVATAIYKTAAVLIDNDLILNEGDAIYLIGNDIFITQYFVEDYVGYRVFKNGELAKGLCAGEEYETESGATYAILNEYRRD